MFIVIQDGVYRHDIWGVCPTMQEATMVAEKKISEEKDDYHKAVVVEFDMGKQCEVGVVATLHRNDKYRTLKWTN